jgi:uncharacterized membrane protein (UPF0182 family)
MDAFTVSDSYPYSTHYRLNGNSISYMRNSVKVVIDAYDGTTTFYVFEPDDPIIAAYRRIFTESVKGCGHDASGASQTRTLPGVVTQTAGRSLRALSYDGSRSFLQP